MRRMRTRILPLLGFLAATSAAAGAGSAGEVAKPVLPWIQDDYARALEDARARKLPLFVEAWAPW